jgi:hypothetical protein
MVWLHYTTWRKYWRNVYKKGTQWDWLDWDHYAKAITGIAYLSISGGKGHMTWPDMVILSAQREARQYYTSAM